MGKKYYFLGIGGISMSSLAIFLKEKGEIVAGSDVKNDHAIELLKAQDIHIDNKINKQAIMDSDVIVYSSAIKPNNEQFVYAQKLKKKMMTRGQLLGKIADEFENVVAISGSHGKTTTTAMIYEILNLAGLKPTLHLGGFRVKDEKNYVLGDRQFFVTEACEYYDNFLNLHPQISVVTNVEKEHMDYFKTFERQLKSFEQFKRQSQIVIEEDENFSAKNIRHDKNGGLIFTLCHRKQKIMRLHLQICENINVKNCIFAYRVAKALNISDQTIKMALERFQGVKTRFELTQNKHFKTIILDYAHHPTEIKNSIDSAKKIYKGRKIVAIFQPHTFSRTKTLFGDFVKIFRKQDNLILFKTYSAREKESEGVSAKDLAQFLNKNYAESTNDLFRQLKKFDQNDVLLFVGAGDLPNILHKKKFIS